MPSRKGRRLPAHEPRPRAYFVDCSGPFGQGHDDDIRDFNKPPAGHPGDVCRIMPEQLLRMNLDLVFRLAAGP
jgi:hypothetical protein